MTSSIPSRVTVLLIDGHNEERKSWTQRLNISSPEYIVLEAETGAAGLAICRSQRVDCVVTELNLPDMSGFTVLVNLIVPRAYHPPVPVIMLSSVSLDHMKLLAKSIGARAYLLKSHTSGDDLDMAIRNALAAVGPTLKELKRSS